jgi:hypothetical protein
MAMMRLVLELKICEACGMLWLRRQDDRCCYCARCAQRFAAAQSAR